MALRQAIPDGLLDAPSLLRRRWVLYLVITLAAAAIDDLLHPRGWDVGAVLASMSTGFILLVDALRLRIPDFIGTSRFFARYIGISVVFFAGMALIVVLFNIVGGMLPKITWMPLTILMWVFIAAVCGRFSFTYVFVAEDHREKNPFSLSWTLTGGNVLLPTILLSEVLSGLQFAISALLRLIPDPWSSAPLVIAFTVFDAVMYCVLLRWMRVCEHELSRSQLDELATLTL